MNRLSTIRDSLIVATALAAVIFALASLAAAAPPADKLNVLFIAVDDLRPEMGCYGASYIKSPNVDRLAATGVTFLKAYCQQAVCSPSRTSLLTGLRPDSTKVYDLETHFRNTVPDVVTLPQHFKNAGYYVEGMGKIYHGGLDDKASWSVPWRGPSKSKSYNSPENLEIMRKNNAAAKAKGPKGKDLSRASRAAPFEGADVPDGAYPDGEIADMGVEALGRLAQGDKPFFLAVGFLKPHLPFNCPKKYWDMYDAAEIELAPNPFPPKNMPEMAGTSFGEIRAYEGVPAKGPIDDALARTLKHGYYACISSTDALIGRLVDELERLGLRDSTAIVLWGDHGWKLGEHGMWCKHTNFELDCRSTLLLSAPKAKGNGKPSEALVEFVDIYPTLCELAGLPLPGHLEGTSFAPVLQAPDRPWEPAAFSQYPRGSLMGYSMRTDRWRLTRWVDRKNPDNVAAVELYDEIGDPMENANVAGEPANATILKQLTDQARRGWQESAPPR
jgi:arylsulfatase A-like enzyme